MSAQRNVLSAGLLVLGLATATAGAALPPLELETYTLANGLQVILHEDHTIPTVSVNIWYHVGSKDEKPGRTGFAHLFEHMMFQGSEHQDRDYFLPLQKIGAEVNGSTNTDRTNYWENVPADQLQLALCLEADRMGWLLPAMTQEKLDNQRDVVKNEKRQGENRPYAGAREILHGMLYPEGHPYRWTTIGSMDDLSAASLEDVQDFFRLHYAPNNASLCVAGDFDPRQAKAWIEAYFAAIPPGRPLQRLTSWIPTLDAERRAVAEDAVDLPRLYMNWHTPGYYAPGDAEFDLLGEILGSGKTSRLHRRLVLDLRIAQDVSVRQLSREMSGVFEIRATAAPGHTAAELETEIDAALTDLLAKGVRDDEVARARTVYEADFVRSLQQVGGFGGKADRLNRYNVFVGTPDYLEQDLARYTGADAGAIDRYARRYLGLDNRVVLHIVPQGTLAAAPTDDVERDILPGSSGPVPFTPPPIRLATLANGLRVCVVENHALPLVEFQLNILSGWSSDPADRAGTAALTADLLDEGVHGRDAVGLARAIAAIGAELSTGSSFDGSTVSLNVLKSEVPAGLELMREVVREPAFSAADFERVRQSYTGRQQQEARQPRLQAVKELQARIFGPDHPYAQPYTGSGTAASLAALTLADLQAFHAAHYRPNNAALVIVGDVTPDEAVALAAKAFGDWRRGDRPEVPVPPAPPYTGAPIVVIDRPDAAQSYIVGGYADLPRNDPDHLAMEVVNAAFGGQFASRINLNLREDKGYTYGVRSQLLSLRDGGAFLMAAPVETGVTVPALRELRAEMEAIRGDRPLVGDELADSRNRLVMGFPAQFETIGAVAGAAGELLRNDLPLDDWQSFGARVAAIDAAAVAGAVERRLDPARLLWVIVGDGAVIVPELRAAGLGQVEVVSGN